MDQTVEKVNKPIEVVYSKPKMSKRIMAYFIDIGLFVMSTLILFSIFNVPVTHSTWYKSHSEELTQLRNESGLYVEDETIIAYVESNEEYDSYTKRKDELSKRINSFYYNEIYFSDIETNLKKYSDRKLQAKSENVNLFVKNENEVVENPGASHEALYNFYKSEISNYSLGYLFNNPRYTSLVKFTFHVTVVEFVVLITITHIIFFLVLPLTCFKRGRQTLGTKLENVGLISYHADNISTGMFILRYLFNFVVFVPLNFACFLIPSLISVTIMYAGKTNSSLTNYVFNDYAVDVTNQKIYFNSLEREEAQIKLQDMSIENKDLRLK